MTFVIFEFECKQLKIYNGAAAAAVREKVMWAFHYSSIALEIFSFTLCSG